MHKREFRKDSLKIAYHLHIGIFIELTQAKNVVLKFIKLNANGKGAKA